MLNETFMAIISIQALWIGAESDISILIYDNVFLAKS